MTSKIARKAQAVDEGSPARQRVAWFETAKKIRALVGEGNSPWTSDAVSVKRKFAETTGYSLNLINRYLTLDLRIERIAMEQGLRYEDIISDSFNATETAARVYQLNPGDSVKLLKLINQRKITLSEIRKRTKELSTRIYTGRSTIGLDLLLLNTLRRNGSEIWGKDGVVARRRGSLLGSSNNFEVLVDAERQTYDFIENYRWIWRGAGKQLESRIARSMTMSSFVRNLYIIYYPDPPSEVISMTIKVLDWLEAPTIGVLESTETEELIIHRVPVGTPCPDRQHLYLSSPTHDPGERSLEEEDD